MATPTKELKKPGGGYDPREVKTVHDWIDLLKDEGEYREVNVKVDWDCEIGTIARYCMSAENGVALLFDNIKGHANTFVRNSLPTRSLPTGASTWPLVSPRTPGPEIWF